MILLDTNALIVLLIGLIDPKLINSHKRTSIYSEEDFHDLTLIIDDVNNIVALPNIWTEVDNLLNNFKGDRKREYIKIIENVIKSSTEIYLKSEFGVSHDYFYSLGLTDTLIIKYAKKCRLLVTSDSSLSDHALANGIEVYDMVKVKNEKFKKSST